MDIDTTAGKALKDSGKRSEFQGGAVRDMQAGKGRCDLLPHYEIGTLIDRHMKRMIPTATVDGLEKPSKILYYIKKFGQTANDAYLYDAISLFLDLRGWDVYTAVMEVSIQYEQGADKYGEHNWEKGLPTYCYISSGIRHLMKYMRGDNDEPHDRAFLFNMLGAIYNKNHNPNLHDTYISSCQVEHVG